MEDNFPKETMMEWCAGNEPVPVRKRNAFRTGGFYGADNSLVPSGLLGPAQVNLKRVYLDEK